MTKVTELAIRARAAAQYPGWRLDITGPGTAVMTNISGAQAYGDLPTVQEAPRWPNHEGS